MYLTSGCNTGAIDSQGANKTATVQGKVGLLLYR